MVYDWDRHQQTCYRLYIVEDKCLEDIRSHLKSAHGFTPSKRAFQTQFRRWNFPPKQRPAHANDRLVSRVEELWGKNLAQREMLRVLNDEDGFNIKARELMRLRARNRWLLRAPNGDGLTSSEPEGGHGTLKHEFSNQRPAHVDFKEPDMQSKEAAAEGRVKHAKQSRRRRRRRAAPDDRAGSNARFPSEMTLDQACRILDLEPLTYRSLRHSFQLLCHQEGVSKKTLAGTERWEALKARPVRDTPQLQAALWSAKDDPGPGELALDVICIDVTKRMRGLETRMTLAEAKNALGVNPEESRTMRADLHRVLSESSFMCKSEASPQQWEDLKQRWSERSVLVQRVLNSVDSARDSRNKVRALEVVAKDVMKRIRDGRGRKGTRDRQQPSLEAGVPSYEEQASSGDETTEHRGSPAEEPRANLRDGMDDKGFDDMSEASDVSQMTLSTARSSRDTALEMPAPPLASTLSNPREAQSQAPILEASLPVTMGMETQMDLLGTHGPPDFVNEPYAPNQYASTTSPVSVFSHVEPVSSACAAYFRLHPSSSFLANAGLWIATLDSHSVSELRDSAVERFPGTICVRVEGILKDGKGRELSLQIEEDQELSAYLTHLQGAAPNFTVQLMWKTA